MAEAEVEEYRPTFAPHVRGEYEKRTFAANGLPNPQTVKMFCEKCDDHWATVCSTGQVKTHVCRWATLHLHRDALGRPM